MFDREQIELQHRILEALHRIIHLLEHRLPVPPIPITHFKIKEIDMPLAPIAPGFSPQFTATPQPAGTVLNPAQPIPVWTSSDTTNSPVTVDSTGLVATVAIPTTAVVGTVFQLSVSYTNADGTTASGSASFTIVAAPPMDVTGFSIAQTA